MSEPRQSDSGVHEASNDSPLGASPSSAAMRALLLLNLGMIVCLAAVLLRGVLWPTPRAEGPAASPEELEAIALALEELGLDADAAAAWEDYLRSVPEADDRATVLFHAGQLLLQAERYEEAAAVLARASFAAGDNRELKDQIGARLIVCFRGMGRYGGISGHLERVSGSGKRAEDEEVVAELGDRVVTDADLDRIIEYQVDRELAMEGAGENKARRQAKLRQAASPALRARLLRQLVQNELFIRRARELGLDQQYDFLLARQQTVDNLLLRRLLARELHVPTPTQKDIEAFYEAHKSWYRRKPTIDAAVIRVADEKEAASLLEKVASDEDFRELVRKLQKSSQPGPQKVFGRQLQLGRPDQVLGNIDGLFQLDEGQWTKAPLTNAGNQFIVFVNQKLPERTLSLTEAGQDVLQRYMRREQQKAVDELFNKLKDRYGAKLLLEAPPGNLDDLSGQSDGMLGETDVKTPKPEETPPVVKVKPGNPLRKPEVPSKPEAEGEKAAAPKKSGATAPGADAKK